MTAYVIRRTVGKTTMHYEYFAYEESVGFHWVAELRSAKFLRTLETAKHHQYWYCNEATEIVELELIEKGVVG